MTKSKLVSEAYKWELVAEYLAPALGIKPSGEGDKIDDLARRTKLQFTLKHQELESPGGKETGCLWLSIGAMCHSYIFCDGMNYPHGTAIFKRRELIFNGNSLVHGASRLDYIQMIEPGEILSVSYPDILKLMGEYDDVNTRIRAQADQQAIDFRERNTFRNLSSVERVKRLRAENETFINCATQEIHAMHAYMSLKHYGNITRAL
jgi:hypothetical protein